MEQVASPKNSGRRLPKDGFDHNHLVYGTIERGGDAWEILLDAARLLKNPSKFPGKNRPARVDTVLSSGYSQGGALQLEMLVEGLDPKRVYDGHFIQMIGLGCWKRDDSLPHFGFLGDCTARFPPDGRHAPVMMLVSETDMVVYPTLGLGKSAFFARNRTNPNWRQYEMAGIAHIPEPIVALGLPNQNSADPRPLFRAAFDNLARWARSGKHGKKPPASRYFEGYVDANDAFIPTTRMPTATSPAACGSLMSSRRFMAVSRARRSAITGRSMRRAPGNVFVFLGGTFERFSDEELLARYPTRHGYVKRVKRAADDLDDRGYITRKDRRALIKAAEDEPLYASDFVGVEQPMMRQRTSRCWENP